MADEVIEYDTGIRFDAGYFYDQPASIISSALPPVLKKKGKHQMDYIPNKRSDRYLWYKNLSTNVVAEAAKFGGVAGDATAMKALADSIVAKMDATDAAQGAVDSAREVERTTEASVEAQVRAKVRNWKTLSGYPASGSEAVLQLAGADSGFDAANYKPVIKLSPAPGQVRVQFTKKGVDGITIYSRLRGTATWQKIGMDTEAPYFDTRPLAQAGVPEAREYMARGVLHDEEIGLDSDVASITFAG